MNALLDGARRRARRVVGRVRRRLAGNDDGGFILLESIIAISLITVIMAAIGAEYVSGIAAVARQRATQSAAQVADSTLEQVRALRPSDLVTGRGVTSVTTQFDKGAAISVIKPWLQDMDPTSDSSAAADAGADATIPTCDPLPRGASGPAVCTQKPGTVPFTVSQFLGNCWLVASGDTSSCVPAAQKTPSSVKYLRVVVSVSWQSGSCNTGCYYVTDSLISADADPTFKTNQPPPAAPVIDGPGDQNNEIGDRVSLQLSLVTGTGIPGYTWSVLGGPLPTGLSMDATTGLIAGTVEGPDRDGPITVQLTDGFGRTDRTTFTWTVRAAPTIAAPVNEATTINAKVTLPITSSCSNTPCEYALSGAPAGLSIDPATGTISGTPTTSGLSNTVTVSVTDKAGARATTAAFRWAITTTFAAAMNNVGVTADTDRSSGNFNGSGSSFSQNSIATNGGPTAGATFSVGGAAYVWPTTAGSGSADNVLASGQLIAYGGSGRHTLSFLVAAAHGSSTGTGTITYADGTTQSYTVTAPNWRTSQSTYAVTSSNVNTANATTAQNTYIVASPVTLNSTKTISYITLPKPDSGQLHVFAISQPPLVSAFNNVGVVTKGNKASGDFDGSNNAISYNGIVKNGGPVAGASVTSPGASYMWPATAGTGTADNALASGQVVPFTASGGSTLSFLVSSTYGAASGSGSIKYADGTTESFTLNADDWGTPSAGALVAFIGANRISSTSGPHSPARPVYIESINIPVSPSNTIEQITLPTTSSNPKLHIFAIGYN